VIDRGNNDEGTTGEKRWPRGEKKNYGKKLIFPTLASNVFMFRIWNSLLFIGGRRGTLYLFWA